MRLIKIFRMTLTGVIILFILLTIFIVSYSKLSGSGFNLFGYKIETVLSGSMTPTFKTGSVITVKSLDDPSALRKNDVISFHPPGNSNMLITHRITKVSKNDGQLQFETKGDHNQTTDLEKIPSQNVVGQYTGFTIPYIGYFVEFLGSKLGCILLLILPGFILVVSSLVAIWRTISRLEKSNNNSLES
ncbi:signal peptidase I SipW [Scopulibacillus cellulosilyticus]|uniref:Signal peptidase I n=1 Tax=Scopulibacillus cellulosilyticus TaxID=2665665 RepID=A0ABW2PYJ1_9BACL